MTRSIPGLLMLVAISLAAVGCVTSRAQIPEPQPALVVPPVPPRAIEPPAVTAPPAAPAPAELPPVPAAATRPKPSRPPAEAKPDPKQEPPAEPVAAAHNPPVAPLRTPTAPTGAEATRQILDIIGDTQKMLDKVDVQGLKDDRKAHYTSAKAFIQQAEEALRKEELTQARGFAERAQNFAKLLLTGR